jgi:hypothetical protein
MQEGGGFCGQRTESRDLDLGSYDGVRLRVRGDGQTFKLNLKTVIVPAGLPEFVLCVLSVAPDHSLQRHTAAGVIQCTLFLCPDS